MQRSLNESEFARMRKTVVPGYSVTSGVCYNGMIRTYYKYESDPTCFMAISEETSEGSLALLIIYQSCNADKFITDYKVSPYAYNYCLFSCDGPLQNIHPFTYIIGVHATQKSMRNVELLPLCVTYEGEYNIRSVLNEPNEELEYEVIKRLQDGESFSRLKSARN
mgnify:CR=1 FL=1